MTESKWERRITNIVVAGFLAAFTVAGPVDAKPKGNDGGQSVTICHVTNSATNPYVVITIDEAAWDGVGANDHTHHVSKDGRVDFEIEPGQDCSEPTDDDDGSF